VDAQLVAHRHDFIDIRDCVHEPLLALAGGWSRPAQTRFSVDDGEIRDPRTRPATRVDGQAASGQYLGDDSARDHGGHVRVPGRGGGRMDSIAIEVSLGQRTTVDDEGGA